MHKTGISERPLVGLGVLIRKDGKVLIGKRKGSHGGGRWAPPGGHLEFNEEFDECAVRETREEAGIKIKNIKFLTAINDIMNKEGQHYITIYMVADYASGEPKVMEPDRWSEWRWFSWNSLPEPLFIPMQNLLKQGLDPFRL